MWESSKAQQLQEIINSSRNIVFFGGAGVSTESGIPDFRSVDGLYKQQYRHPPEKILSHSFFMEHTDEFFEFYRAKMLCPWAHPNAAHHALAKLESAGKLKAVITQNIDGLHTAAGSRAVFELHGSVNRNRCMKCKAEYGLNEIINSSGIPRCSCGGIIKPDVVLYEEPLNQELLQRAVHAIEEADCLIVGGTSLNVYPAAGFTEYYSGNSLVLINKSATALDSRADMLIQESIAKVLSIFM